MVKTLTKHGNSLALVIDKPILDLLNINVDTPLSITTDGYRLVIAPSDLPRRLKFKAALENTMDKYAEAFKRLAE